MEIIWSQMTITAENLNDAQKAYASYANRRCVGLAALVPGNVIVTQTMHTDDPFSDAQGCRTEYHWLARPIDVYIKFREVDSPHNEDNLRILELR